MVYEYSVLDHIFGASNNCLPYGHPGVTFYPPPTTPVQACKPPPTYDNIIGIRKS